jgi:anaerobic magnesium-protoporphyrin IX monomethyl ester cyclase
MKLLFTEPVQNDLAIIKKYNLRPVGLRLGPLFLASYLRTNLPEIQVTIQENRLRISEKIPFDFEQEINSHDIIAISCMTNEFPDAFNILKVAKSLAKITILGGLFPSSNSEFVLGTNLVDYVVHGEGELAFTNLLGCILKNGDTSKVKGISYKKNHVIIHNPPETLLKEIDILPAYDLVSLATYANHERAPIMTTRGCPHYCTFCTLAPHWGRLYRMQSIGTVIQQMKLLENAGFKKFNIIDETFTIDRERTEALLRTIIAKRFKNELKNIPIKIKVRLDTIDEPLVKLMKEANIEMIQVGVETINLNRLKELSKNLHESDIEKKLDLILNAGIALNPIFIFGYKGQEIIDLYNDVKFIKKVGCKPNVTTFLSFNTPHPSSYEWINSKKLGLRILTGNLNYYNHKMLVCVPENMGTPEYSLKLLQNHYNETVSFIKMQHENPLLVDTDYITKENPKLNHLNKIWF